MTFTKLITPCLWFDGQAEDAARFYTGIFPNSRILKDSRFLQEGQEIHHQEPGSVMTVQFELDGQPFTALNGGPDFKFSEAISFQINCTNQDEIDYYWERLGEGGDPAAQQCGWLKDRFGVSWQVLPSSLGKYLTQGTPEQRGRAMEALLGMKKLEIEGIEKAWAEVSG